MNKWIKRVCNLLIILGVFGLLGSPTRSMAADITDLEGTTGYVGKEDIKWGTGQTTDTFPVTTYDGGSATLTKLPDLDPGDESTIKGVWYVAAMAGDHGNAVLTGSLAWVIAVIDGDPAVVELPGNQVYQVSTNLTVPATITLDINHGAIFSVDAGKTLTVNGGVPAGAYQIFSGDGTVAFGNGAVKEVYPQWWYSTGDYAMAVQAAITAHKRVAFVGDGASYTISTKISLPSADREIIGYGRPILTTASANSIFEQTNHGVLTTFRGLKFTGDGTGIHYDMADSDTQYWEYLIEDCIFNQDAGVYGIIFDGAREGKIIGCFFETCNGIYSTHTAGTHIGSSDFKNCAIGVFQDGGGVPYSCGLSMDQVSMLGCTEAIKVSRSDDFRLTNSNIDSNDKPLQLLGMADAEIIGNYIANKTADPAIYAVDATEHNEHLLFVGNEILGVYDAANTFDAVYLENTIYTKFVANEIHFYTRYGISLNGDTIMDISNNYFSPRAGHGVNSIFNRGVDNSSIRIVNNVFTQDPSTTNATYAGNSGWNTSYEGTANVLSGNTTVVVAHNMDVTPDIILITRTQETTTNPVTSWWVHTVGAANFTIEVNADPGALNCTFAWRASKVGVSVLW